MSEPEELLGRLVVADLTDELGIFGPVRDSMLDDPILAREALETARRKRRARNPAALAIALFRQALARAPRPVDEPEPGPPSLSALEFLWSLEPTHPGTAQALLPLFSAVIGRFGGFRALHDSFGQRDRYDAAGELAERETLVDVDDRAA